MNVRVLVAAGLLLFVAACGNGDEGASVDSGQQLADMIGCTGYEGDSEEMYVTEGGACQLDGDEIYVYYFSDNDRRDSWVEVASQFGGPYLVGDGWVVDAKPAVLDDIKADHGGELSD